MDEPVLERRPGKQSAEAAERTRRAIGEAALELFADRGFDGVGLRDIAERAGTTHGLLRHHFGSKGGVWRAVVDAADAEYAAALRPLFAEAAAKPDEAAAATLEAVARGVIRVSARHPTIVRLLAHEATRGGVRLDYILASIAPLRSLLAPVFARAQRRGLLQQFDPDTFFLFLLTAGAMPFAFTALTDELLGAATPPEERAERHADRIIATLFGESKSSTRGR